MPALFLITAGLIFFGGSEYEVCKKDGITNVKDCAEKVVSESKPMDYSKLNG